MSETASMPATFPLCGHTRWDSVIAWTGAGQCKTMQDWWLDVQALAQHAVAVGQVIAGARGTMASVDLNPVMVGAAGEGAVVVDALVECAGLPASGL